MNDIHEMGAIDWFLIEAPDREMTGELVAPLLDLVDRRLIRIIDVLILVKRGEGEFESLTTAALDVGKVGDLGALACPSGLLSDDDATEAASLMQPNSIGLFIVYENLWSVPFAVAARKAGGQLVAHGYIPTQALVAVLDSSSPDERKYMPDFFVGWPGRPFVAGTATAVSNRVLVSASQSLVPTRPSVAPPQYAEPQYAAAVGSRSTPRRASAGAGPCLRLG